MTDDMELSHTRQAEHQEWLKKQIQQMVKMLLGLNVIPKPDDAADALALAICHAHSNKMNSMLNLNTVR